MMEIGHCKEEEGEETFFSAEEEEVEEEDKVKEKTEEEEVEEGFHGFEYRRSLFGLASRKKKLKREVERAEQDLDKERDLTETEKLVKETMDPYGLSLGIRLTESSTAVQESENLTNNNEQNGESRDRAREGGGERKASIYDNKGVLLHSGLDLCDCLEDSCPGCYFPCPKCKSPKCGHECKCSKGADDAGGEEQESAHQGQGEEGEGEEGPRVQGKGAVVLVQTKSKYKWPGLIVGSNGTQWTIQLFDKEGLNGRTRIFEADAVQPFVYTAEMDEYQLSTNCEVRQAYSTALKIMYGME